MIAKLNYDGFSNRVYLFGNSVGFSIPEVEFLQMIQEYNEQRQKFEQVISQPRSFIPEEHKIITTLEKLTCILEKVERKLK